VKWFLWIFKVKIRASLAGCVVADGEAFIVAEAFTVVVVFIVVAASVVLAVLVVLAVSAVSAVGEVGDSRQIGDFIKRSAPAGSAAGALLF
jgi:hypothetical protein